MDFLSGDRDCSKLIEEARGRGEVLTVCELSDRSEAILPVFLALNDAIDGFEESLLRPFEGLKAIGEANEVL